MTSDDNSPFSVASSAKTCNAVRRHEPSATRNTGPILEVLHAELPATGRALEIASGTGQHAVAFARAFPGIVWQPSDKDDKAKASVAARVSEEGLENLLPPLHIDVMVDDWCRDLPAELDLMVCINMIHISPWAACEGLMAGAGALLRSGGMIYFYGPYKRDGRHTAPSNEAFDASLRSRDPQWGVRDIVDLARVAGHQGMLLERTVAMPANNFSLIFRKS